MSRFIITVVLSSAIAVHAQEAPKGPVNVSIACLRQSVTATESFLVKLTISNDSKAITFDRSQLVSARSFVASTYDRKGQWATVIDPPASGSLELRPGETFTIEARLMLPEALTKQPTSLLVEWVGSGAFDGLRSNQATIGVRVDQTPTATLETSEGTIVLELWSDKAPNHVANFVTLAKAGFYDGVTFHRVIPNFMVQAGEPKTPGEGAYKIPAEMNEAPFVKGTVGMARGSKDTDSNGSQFFICVADKHELDKQYTGFGRVLEGQEVADKISMVARDPQKDDRPLKNVMLKKVTVSTPAGYAIPEVKKVVPAAESKPESRAESR